MFGVLHRRCSRKRGLGRKRRGGRVFCGIVYVVAFCNLTLQSRNVVSIFTLEYVMRSVASRCCALLSGARTALPWFSSWKSSILWLWYLTVCLQMGFVVQNHCGSRLGADHHISFFICFWVLSALPSSWKIISMVHIRHCLFLMNLESCANNFMKLPVRAYLMAPTRRNSSLHVLTSF